MVKREILKNSILNIFHVNGLLAYASGLYSNMGNYQGYGDTKIVPDLKPEKFEAIVTGSQAYENDPITMQNIWSSVKGPMFNFEERYKQLGLGDKGVTTYFTPNCNQEDADLVNRYLKSKNIESKYSCSLL